MLRGGEWHELLPQGHPGILEAKWCRNRFALVTQVENFALDRGQVCGIAFATRILQMEVNRTDDVMCLIAKIRKHLIVEINNIFVHSNTCFAGVPVCFL